MAKGTPLLEWCIVRLGEDHNWWVGETSDPVHWDVDGLSIIDPRQVDHIIELVEPLREYGFDANLFERAFIPFRINKDLGKGRVRLARTKQPLLESEEKLFALPDVIDEENGPYADFLDHITRLRVKLLNDLIQGMNVGVHFILSDFRQVLFLEQPLQLFFKADEFRVLLVEVAGQCFSGLA